MYPQKKSQGFIGMKFGNYMEYQEEFLATEDLSLHLGL